MVLRLSQIEYDALISRMKLGARDKVGKIHISKSRRRCDMASWTPGLIDDVCKAASGGILTAHELAELFGMSPSAIRNAAARFGFPYKHKIRPKAWSDEELADMRAEYSKPFPKVNDLAARLGREAGNVSRKAREFGLTNQCRPKIPPEQKKPPKQNKYASREELLAAMSTRSKEWIRLNGHPRGFLGGRHSEETKAAQSELSKRMWSDPQSKFNSPELAQKRSDLLISRVVAGQMRHGRTRCKGGKRPDIGDIYFRSSWEANYARYLNWLAAKGDIDGWQYEPRTFVFEAIKRGTRAYTPDFLVRRGAGHEWHEVKGWMDVSSRVRLERMAQFFPQETVKVIGPDWFKSANRTGLPSMIPGWE